VAPVVCKSGEPRSQTVPLLSTQSAAANNARATDRACAVVRYSSWSADSHTPTSPFGFCTAATSAEKPSSPRSGGQCGPKWTMGPVSPSGCSVWHQLGQVVDVMPSILRQPSGHGRMGGMRLLRGRARSQDGVDVLAVDLAGQGKPRTHDKISTRPRNVLTLKRICPASLREVNPSGQFLFSSWSGTRDSRQPDISAVPRRVADRDTSAHVPHSWCTCSINKSVTIDLVSIAAWDRWHRRSPSGVATGLPPDARSGTSMTSWPRP
jgi:hypothetical protein